MSARPGPCGGHRATGVPTAIDTYPRVQLSTLSGRIVCGLVSIRRLSRGVSSRNASAVTFRLEFQRDGGVCMALPCTTGHPPNGLPVAGFTVLRKK